MDLQLVPPGIPQMPVLIYERREEYVGALRAADASIQASAGTQDLTDPALNLDPMCHLIEDAMTRQLAGAIARLAGRPANAES
jgi:hypothetical protein